MNNQLIIDQRWKKTEKSFRKYLKQIRLLYRETGDDVIDILKSLNVRYEDLNRTVPSNVRRQVRRKIETWRKEGIVKGYFAYMVSSLTRYTYAKVLEILIYGLYLSKGKQINAVSNRIFKETAQDCYDQGKDDLKQERKDMTWTMILPFLMIPDLNVTYEQYLTALQETASDEMYRKVLECVRMDAEVESEDLDPLLEKQSNRVLNVNDDKESGIVVDTARGVGNGAYASADDGKDQLIRFIAEVDDKTTKMCRSLDGQIFHTQAWNRFTRYSDYYKGLHTFYWFGLERGLNMPPINDHFHWCRSTMTYQIDMTGNLYRMMRDFFPDIVDNLTPETYDKLVSMLKNIDSIKTEHGFKDKIGIDNYVEVDGTRHYIDGKNIVLDPNDDEILYAFKFQNEFGKNVSLRPRMRGKDARRVSDYLIDGVPHDLKCIDGSGEKTISKRIRKSKDQAENFIIKVNEGSRTVGQAINDIKKAKKNNNWIKTVYLFDENDNYIREFK